MDDSEDLTSMLDKEYFRGVIKKGISKEQLVFNLIKRFAREQQEGKPLPYYFGIIEGDTLEVYKTGGYEQEILEVYYRKDTVESTQFKVKGIHLAFSYSRYSELGEIINKLGEGLSVNYYKVPIDEHNIIGWATTYYRLKPEADTGDLIGHTGQFDGELRQPTVLKDYIQSYQGTTNIQFAYLLDKLNPKDHQRSLGTFYTPRAYADLSKGYIHDAIRKHQKSGHTDYVILDRCAGTGNLELTLNDDVPDDIHDKDILSHVILNTYSYGEYLILVERFGDKVRYINPPVHKDTLDYLNDKYSGTDALSQEFLDNEVIKQYIEDPNVTMILFENPPFSVSTSVEHQKRGASQKVSSWRGSAVVQTMRADKTLHGNLSTDMVNVFIWSAYHYYLRQPSDSYIVFSPIKYWKSGHLVKRVFQGGFACNRKHFHARVNSLLLCASWGYELDEELESFSVPAYDIGKDGQLQQEDNGVTISRVYGTYQKMFDKRVFPDDRPTQDVQGYNGRPAKASLQFTKNAITNPNIIANLIIAGVDFSNPDLDSGIVRVCFYGGKGFYLRDDTFINYLPIFAASRYVRYNSHWTERGLVYKTSDGYERIQKDSHTDHYQEFLTRCLIFTSLDAQNHNFSFEGVNGDYYRNELCLDTTHGDTAASKLVDRTLMTDKDSIKLLTIWDELLEQAKQTDEYQEHLTYGVYQIDQELNKMIRTGNKKEAKYPELNTLLKTLRDEIKVYYNTHLLPVLFEYEYLK